MTLMPNGNLSLQTIASNTHFPAKTTLRDDVIYAKIRRLRIGKKRNIWLYFNFLRVKCHFIYCYNNIQTHRSSISKESNG